MIGVAALASFGAKCKDPPEESIGGLVLAIRTIPADGPPDVELIRAIDIQAVRIDVVCSGALDGEQQIVTLDEIEREIELNNTNEDIIVTKLAVNTGFVHQIRIYPKNPNGVEVELKNDSTEELDKGPNLPSWYQSGWKVVPQDGTPWEVIDDQLIGVRALFDFDDRVLHNKGVGYKIKPTIPAETFTVNPPDGAPGVYFDQLTVVFKPGLTQQAIDDVISEFGYTLMSPKFGTAYRVKIPPEKNVDEAAAFYASRPEVQGVLPAMNFGLFDVEPDEGASPQQSLVNLPLAWETLLNETGRVGSRSVRVAVVDSGVRPAYRDLVTTYAINQGELPRGLFDANDDSEVDAAEIAAFDVDGDGLISFKDLRSGLPMIEPIRPVDWQEIGEEGHGEVDLMDLLTDPAWADGVDDDNNLLDDDLSGWSFTDAVHGAAEPPCRSALRAPGVRSRRP